MQLIEFKAWFKGYSENIVVSPTREQFDRIKEEIDNIQSDRYYDPNTFKVPSYVSEAKSWVDFSEIFKNTPFNKDDDLK